MCVNITLYFKLARQTLSWFILKFAHQPWIRILLFFCSKQSSVIAQILVALDSPKLFSHKNKKLIQSLANMNLKHFSIKNTQKLNHKNLTVKQCGFLVKYTHPYCGASSDNIVSCTCHNERVLEIKCPHNYKNELKHCRNDKRFPLNPDGSLKENHLYYFRIQMQMFIHNLNNGHFLIFCK